MDRMMDGDSAEELIATLVGGSQRTSMAVDTSYDGASSFDRSVGLWNPPLRSADADMLPEKGRLDARVRDMRRNDGYVQTGQVLHRDHVVGSMYTLNAQPELRVLGVKDEKWAEEFQQEVEAKYMLAAESPNNWFDAQRTKNVTELIRLAVGVYSTGGEVLATAEWIRPREDSRRPFNTAIQMIDADRLSTPYEFMNSVTRRVRAGIELNNRNRPIGYHIRKAHPSDRDRMVDSWKWDFVKPETPWGRQQVLHIKEEMRVDQTRGIAEMVAGLKETRIAKRFRDVSLQQAVLAATYAASIESDLPPAEVFAAMGANEGGQTPYPKFVNAYASQFLGSIADYSSAARNMRLDGARIPHFYPGTRLTVRQVGAPGGVGQEFEQSILRYLAAIFGVSYEELSRDYSKTNYSSARAAMSNTWRFMQSRKKIVADRMANFIFALWFEEMVGADEIEAMKTATIPNFYDPMMKEAYCQATWIGAARGQIDELKETQAAALRIKMGLSTREDELARFGKDWRKVFAQLEREQKEAETRNLVFVEDNSMNAASGSPRDNNGDQPQDGQNG